MQQKVTLEKREVLVVQGHKVSKGFLGPSGQLVVLVQLDHPANPEVQVRLGHKARQVLQALRVLSYQRSMEQ
jgi:hypothetical protein